MVCKSLALLILITVIALLGGACASASMTMLPSDFSSITGGTPKYIQALSLMQAPIALARDTTLTTTAGQNNNIFVNEGRESVDDSHINCYERSTYLTSAYASLLEPVAAATKICRLQD